LLTQLGRKNPQSPRHTPGTSDGVFWGEIWGRSIIEKVLICADPLTPKRKRAALSPKLGGPQEKKTNQNGRLIHLVSIVRRERIRSEAIAADVITCGGWEKKSPNSVE